mmetsp:Transcript_65870/g.121412  ORF Transcript_65870/g.121412 Transcript_65870/m.121412 type:complete len:374 (-) Transcript_65870:70-1191(-)
MAAHGGHRVGIRHAGSSSSDCSRGWRVLREQWRDFLQKRPEIPGRVLSDHKVKVQPLRPCDLGLNKEGIDRMLDKILAQLTGETPRSQATIGAWRRAEMLNTEMRTLIGDRLSPQKIAAKRAEAKKVPHPSLAFFPQDWSSALSEETVAELIVDAFASSFCDALIDGAVSLVDVSRKWNSTVQKSASEPQLSHPKAIERLRTVQDSTDKKLLNLEFHGQEEATRSDGFTMAGLTDDQWEAWNQRTYHKCKPLEPFTKRIEKATLMQRPNRRIERRRTSSLADKQKFIWPMTATHFPERWEANTYRPRSRQSDLTMQQEGEEPEGDWLLRLGKDGKTTFPYSLVSHRAFIESLPDPVLKEKARKVAPLRFTGDW